MTHCEYSQAQHVLNSFSSRALGNQWKTPPALLLGILHFHLARDSWARRSLLLGCC